MNRNLNLTYSSIQGSYWMHFGVIISFASVFLLNKGYTNSEIGIMLALSSSLAVIIQPLLADVIDRSEKISLPKAISRITIILIILTFSLYFFSTQSIFLSLAFVLLASLSTSLQPLINSVAFYFTKIGHPINFGITRSVGSVSYAVLVAILGFAVSRYNTNAIPTAGIIVLLILLASTHHINNSSRNYTEVYNNSMGLGKSVKSTNISLLEFSKRHKFFLVFSISILFVFFQNAVINNYLIQIINEIGGTSSQMGSLYSFMALLEIPGLFFFSKLRKRFTCQFMLKVSSVAFILKVLFTYMATSVSMVYFAFLFQLISFPIYLSSSVHLVDEIMDKGEVIKGQALVTGMMTLSGVFASLFGGFILDIKGPSTLLLLSIYLAIIGTVILFLVINKIENKQNSSAEK